jgi:hypothetical protein
MASSKLDAPNRAKIGKSLRDIEKVFGAQGKGAWPNNAVSVAERALGELLRTFEKGQPADKLAFYAQAPILNESSVSDENFFGKNFVSFVHICTHYSKNSPVKISIQISLKQPIAM